MPVLAHAGGASFAEAALFTHRGLSGPAILQISSYWRHGQDIAIDFLHGRETDWLTNLKRAQPNTTLRRALSSILPDRLAEALTDRLGATAPLHQQRDAVLAGQEARLRHWTFRPNGTEGFAKAEVTIGGIATDGLSQKDLGVKTVAGLHIIGEAVDVTGWLGGYNFQWAWASGWAAGQAL
jgi:predicted Rossmann fold flavoprotein